MLIFVRKGLLLLLCCLTATPAVAAAQEDKVFVDPGSPSGKEYALPIDRAREQGSSTQRQPQKLREKAPLFGEGVEGGVRNTTSPPTPKSSAKEAKAERKAGSTSADAREEEAAAREKAAAAAEARDLARTRALRAQAAAPEGGTGVIAVVGAGVVVLLVGGLIGLWLRRRSAA
ncbi:MAG TPA: hypothetical protein VGR11_13645 [Solirubrobacteraceae bacterium]|nr:hypothetical protein [Solirubrobacteraceae bacterium]